MVPHDHIGISQFSGDSEAVVLSTEVGVVDYGCIAKGTKGDNEGMSSQFIIYNLMPGQNSERVGSTLSILFNNDDRL